jgi:uridine phosphorylase
MEEPDTHFTARMLIDHTCAANGISIDDLGVAPTVVLVWGMGPLRALAEKVGAVRSEHWLYDSRHPLYRGKVEGRPVSFAHVPVGAPGTIMMMEEMAACGAYEFWGFTAGGSLQERAPLGTCIIPTSAIAEEGTSAHYMQPDTRFVPNADMVQMVVGACRAEGLEPLTGPVWTTDAPYRETLAKIEAYQRQGVLAVEMETSAMYMFGQVRDVAVCNVLVVSDELFREWSFGGAHFDETRERAANALLRCLAHPVSVSGVDEM